MSREEKIQTVLAFMGALVPLMSALASLLNHMVREREARGETVSATMLKAGVVLNAGAVNLDKALQLAKKARAGAKEAASEG